MLAKGEASASFSFFCSLSLSLLSSFKKTQKISLFILTLSPSLSPLSSLPFPLPPSFRRKHTKKLYEEAHGGKEAHRGKEAYTVEGRKVEVE
jgi:hypothetical protein